MSSRAAIEKLKKLDNLILYNPTSPTAHHRLRAEGCVRSGCGRISLNSGDRRALRQSMRQKILLNVLKTSETIRASLYFYNTKEDVDRFVQACSEITLETPVQLFF